MNNKGNKMNNEFRKPYLASIYGTQPRHRVFVYPRETLIEKDIFPFYILDGGAFFFMNETFGDSTSKTLLEKTLSGEVFEPLKRADGSIDWARSYNFTEGTGMLKQHELQSWPQRLYMLLPLAQEYLRTGDKLYAREWLRILRLWIDDSPYEKYDPSTPHTSTSMKWRDMQPSWRTMSLIHSVYMLGSHDGAFEYNEWKFIYDFIDLNLSHLYEEAVNALATNRYGNHVLQIGSALTSGGILFAELPNAYKYMSKGCEVMAFCNERAIFSDGGSKESSPSYSHFIARLYLEAEMHLELNGYPQIPGLRDSVIAQYSWLAKAANRQGKCLRFSDSYALDAHEDVRNMAEIVGFVPDFGKESHHFTDSGFVMLRGKRLELAFDAMDWYGGHQHEGRMQPILWVDGREILADAGCTSYDNWDLYRWTMSSDAHSIVYVKDAPIGKRHCFVKEFDGENNTVTAEYEVTLKDGRSYVWERSIKMVGDTVEFTDTVKASEDMDFTGNWYLTARATRLLDDKTARQLVRGSVITLNCGESLVLDRVPCLNEDNKQSYLARLQWNKTAREFTVKTVIDCTERII